MILQEVGVAWGEGTRTAATTRTTSAFCTRPAVAQGELFTATRRAAAAAAGAAKSNKKQQQEATVAAAMTMATEEQQEQHKSNLRPLASLSLSHRSCLAGQHLVGAGPERADGPPDVGAGLPLPLGRRRVVQGVVEGADRVGPGVGVGGGYSGRGGDRSQGLIFQTEHFGVHSCFNCTYRNPT